MASVCQCPREMRPGRPRHYCLRCKGRIVKQLPCAICATPAMFNVCSPLCARKLWIREHRAEYLAQQRKARLKRKYGISVERYERLLANQEGVCILCETPPAKKRLAVDHDHKTGKIRGLLCFACNTMIGKAGENPAVLRLAANYLEQGGIVGWGDE